MLVAKKPGVSLFNVWDDQGQHTLNLSIATAMVSRDLVGKIEQSIADPAIKVSEHNGVIVIEGTVETAASVQRAWRSPRLTCPRLTIWYRFARSPPSRQRMCRQSRPPSVPKSPSPPSLLTRC